MSDYQIALLDRRVQYLESKIKDWERVIATLMSDPTFTPTHSISEWAIKKDSEKD